MRMRREREMQAKEQRAQRRRERLEQSTVWEQLTRTFNADDNESDEDAGDVPLPEEEPISLFRRLNTALSIRTVNLAGVLYFGIDLLLCIVFMATQMAGARWVQLSDIFRWYREGRFTVSHSQLCALNFATSWDIDNGRSNAEFRAKRLTKRFFLNAAALMLFALKMFFGLGEQNDDDASRPQPMGGGGGGCAADVAENAVENGAIDGAGGNGGGDDEAAAFNFRHWLLQLQLRMHCWQGTPAHVVLDKGFSACQLERSNTEIPYRRPEVSAMNTYSLGGSRLFHRHRKQAFAGCVPNMVLSAKKLF
uniref:DDE Tnp4 domain-containing protein n=1 Tax=Globodera pallida TaxID=36090 RepID=A0A183BIQ6_GLOPA